MENKYNGKNERTLIEDGYHLQRLAGPFGVYQNNQNKIILARVNEDGLLEVVLEAMAETSPLQASNRCGQPNPSQPHAFDKHECFKKER